MPSNSASVSPLNPTMMSVVSARPGTVALASAIFSRYSATV